MNKKTIIVTGIVLLGGFLLLCSIITSEVLADWALVPKTGQTTSYATGDDGDLEMGVTWPNPRFTNNGDGTVTDNLTGLIWMRNANCFGDRTWSQALSDCNYLSTGQCGLTDGSVYWNWRLPNRHEIASLLDLSRYGPALPVGHPFINVIGLYASYFTSTTLATSNGLRAWAMGMYNPYTGDSDKLNDLNVWCVRGTTNGPAPVPKTGQTTSYATGDDGYYEKGVAWPNPRFTINGDGTVTDNLTGLIWMRNANCWGNAVNWNNALIRCNTLANGACGLADGSSFGDWRLPNRKELDSLSHLEFYQLALPNTAGTGKWSQGNPFNNIYYPPGGNTSNYWSSTTVAYSTDLAWADNFFNSSHWTAYKTSSYTTWCVRGGDLDEDGFPDHADNCPDDFNPGQEDTDGSGIGDICNDALDADGDEWEDGFDNCSEDYNPGQEDADTDTVGDVCDNCPNDYNPGQEDIDTDTVGDACDTCTDTDNDGYGNPGYPNPGCADDNCSDDYNPGQEDTDNSGVGDVCNDALDADGDEWEGGLDNCPDDYNPNQEDIGDADGVGDICDNCPSAANPQQEDLDSDTVGDVCDTCTDSDDDGYGNPGYPNPGCVDDNCPYNPNPGQEDTDGDGIGDICEDCTDTDNDGYGNPGYPNPGCDDDNCPDDANPGQEDLDNDTIGDVCDTCTDTDDDGYGNPGYPANTCPDDNCPDDPNTEQEDTDSDTVGDICDECTDTDDDGYGNLGYPANTCPDDNCPDDPNPMQEDLPDGDGMGDLCDNCPDHPNGPSLGTCVKEASDVAVGMGTTCNSTGDCATGETCDMSQEDINSNDCGDACECYADITGTSGKVDLSDLVIMKAEFNQICPPCTADLNESGKVDLADLVIMKMQFNRSDCPVFP